MPEESYRTSHATMGCGEHYDSLYDRGYELAQWTTLEMPRLRNVFRTLHDGGARRLLDFACGTGRILRLAEDVFSTTWGIDVSATMLDVARQRCRRSTVVHVDATREQLTERFDVVTAFRFFLGAEPQLRSDALKAIATLLDGRGVLIANIHVNRSSPLGLFYRSTSRIRPGRKAPTLGFPAFHAILAAHGFRVRDVYWYSYLPRTGPLLQWLPQVAMRPTEAICTRLPIVPRWIAQSFLVMCEAPLP